MKLQESYHLQTGSSDMNLFEDKNIVTDLDKNLKRYAWNNNLRLISKKDKWNLFENDKLKVKIELIEGNKKNKLEFRASLFSEVSYSIEIMLRFICAEKVIRDIAKSDLINSLDGKIDLVRYINHDRGLTTSKILKKNINGIVKRASKLQDEISSKLDFILQIKLN